MIPTFTLAAISTPAVSAQALSLGLLVAKITLVLLIALGATATMRRASAGARHVVWLTALAMLALFPLLTRWTPIRLAVLPSGFAVDVAATAPNAAQPGRPAATI